MSYELDEAIAIAAATLDAMHPDGHARREAMYELIDCVAEAARRAGLSVETNRNQRGVVSIAANDGGRTAFVCAESDGMRGTIKLGPFVEGRTGGPVKIDLVYNPLAKHWASTERDASIVPVPGKSWPLRSAVAVIMSVVARCLTTGTAVEDHDAAA